MGISWIYHHLLPGGFGGPGWLLNWGNCVICSFFFWKIRLFGEIFSKSQVGVNIRFFCENCSLNIWVYVGYSPVPKQPEKLKNCSAGSWDWGEVNMFFFKCPSFLFPKWIYRQDLTSISTLVQEKNKWTIVQNIISFGVNDGSTIFPLLQNVAFLSLALAVVTSGCLWPKPKAIPWIPKGHPA